eukprot:CAMPEP_0113563670 /NCGR_PEP_ID=MMETSP0015_2-20120614/21195_1 /TAXON_ID=2838 /ORGANISM="Odontella" /LENGTH=171 /DNA_ID=CAMNT_0000465671 /DNA_START=185 /DNA_END=696 /DNA_ORIENTATION=+ /assembly_acc=CAM_ASM_000160
MMLRHPFLHLIAAQAPYGSSPAHRGEIRAAETLRGHRELPAQSLHNLRSPDVGPELHLPDVDRQDRLSLFQVGEADVDGSVEPPRTEEGPVDHPRSVGRAQDDDAAAPGARAVVVPSRSGGIRVPPPRHVVHALQKRARESATPLPPFGEERLEFVDEDHGRGVPPGDLEG